MTQEKKKQAAVIALIAGGMINFLGCIHILPSVVITTAFVSVLIIACFMIITGGQTRTNLFGKENAVLRSAVIFWLVTYLFHTLV